MKGHKIFTVLLVISSVLALANCSSTRTVTATLPGTNSVVISAAGDVQARSLDNLCNYEGTAISCVAAPSDGSAPIIGEEDPVTLECVLVLDSEMTYQFFLQQDDQRCAELFYSTSAADLPTLIGKDIGDFDLGALDDDGNGRLVPTNDPEDFMDTDYDGTADIDDTDRDGDGALDAQEDDTELDGLPDDVDVDDDGDGCLDSNDNTNCLAAVV